MSEIETQFQEELGARDMPDPAEARRRTTSTRAPRSTSASASSSRCSPRSRSPTLLHRRRRRARADPDRALDREVRPRGDVVHAPEVRQPHVRAVLPDGPRGAATLYLIVLISFGIFARVRRRCGYLAPAPRRLAAVRLDRRHAYLIAARRSPRGHRRRHLAGSGPCSSAAWACCGSAPTGPCTTWPRATSTSCT